MRGKDWFCGSKPFWSGITPAYAGKSCRSGQEPFRSQDHPRVCGEKRTQKGSGQVPAGSPPRMRGKVAGDELSRDVLGITPAYAGKSRGIEGVSMVFRDHPRVCGEKDALSFVRANHQGSPPRMRGKENVSCKVGGESRITPAYAGKSPAE